MDIGSIPRHTRKGLAQKLSPANLAAALTGKSREITDFSALPKRSADDQKLVSNLLSFLAQTAGLDESESFDCSPSIDFSPKLQSTVEACHKSAGPLPFASLWQGSRHVNTESLPGGLRQENFDNGSSLKKDALGRVVEVYSCFGECMFIRYDGGELSGFTRIDKSGSLHSTCKKSKDGVSVHDKDGRVKAIGQYMTVDPWGRFYLHNADGQYFSLDLVAGIHCERRRLLSDNGAVNFVTAAFAHDGFRMATSFAKVDSTKQHRRSLTYRFYGRDGTILEFASEEDFRSTRPSRSTPPGTHPVHSTWMQQRQAHTAWESLREYLSRVS